MTALLWLGVPGCVLSTGPDALPIQPLVLEPTSHSGLVEPMRLLIRDPARFAEVWRAAFPDVPVPPVDFDRDMVIVAAMGTQPTGGFAIRVTQVVVTSGGVEADVLLTTPGGCVVPQVVTHPVDIVKVAARRGVISFEERTLRRCR